MAQIDKKVMTVRKRILFVVVGLIIGGISIWWAYHLRGGFTFSLTPWSIFFLALAVFMFIGMRKSKVNTKGGDNDKAD